MSLIRVERNKQMNTSRKPNTQLALLFAAVLLTRSQATATTVTYNFDETGWINTAGTTENFIGSFAGTPGAGGVLKLADLTEFIATLAETNAQNDTKTVATFGLATGTSGLTDFLFDPVANSLTLSGTGDPGATICLGQTVPEGVCGPIGPRPVSKTGVPAPPLDGLFLFSPNGTLNASTTALPTVTTVALTPEPAALFLSVGGLVLLCVIQRIFRKTNGERPKRAYRLGPSHPAHTIMRGTLIAPNDPLTTLFPELAPARERPEPCRHACDREANSVQRTQQLSGSRLVGSPSLHASSTAVSGQLPDCRQHRLNVAETRGAHESSGSVADQPAGTPSGVCGIVLSGARNVV
jgi:hypothetical protein